jgi:hypothetical protein
MSKPRPEMPRTASSGRVSRNKPPPASVREPAWFSPALRPRLGLRIGEAEASHGVRARGRIVVAGEQFRADGAASPRRDSRDVRLERFLGRKKFNLDKALIPFVPWTRGVAHAPSGVAGDAAGRRPWASAGGGSTGSNGHRQPRRTLPGVQAPRGAIRAR